MVMMGRRAVMAGLAGMAAIAGTGRLAFGGTPVTVLAAPSNASILLARAMEAGGLSAGEPPLVLDVWRSPDAMRAAIVSGRAAVVGMPVNVAANLRNRGLPIRLLNVLSLGPMSVVTRAAGVTGPEGLKGRRVQLYFRNDMPDLCFRLALAEAGLRAGEDGDVAIDYAGQATEAAQLVLAGKAETAVLNEPAASAALIAAAARGVPLRRAFTVQEVWGRRHGGLMPLAGVAVTEAVLDAAPDWLRQLSAQTAAAVDWVSTHRQEAAALGARVLGFDQAALYASLAVGGVEVRPAKAARPAIEALFAALAGLSPDIIGGRLPDDGFYAAL